MLHFLFYHALQEASFSIEGEELAFRVLSECCVFYIGGRV